MLSRNTPKLRKRSEGQALIEMAVSFLFLVPLFLVLPIMAGYLEIQRSAYEAVRYIAWEEAASPNMSYVGINDNTLNRFFKSQYAGFGTLAEVNKFTMNSMHTDVGTREGSLIERGALYGRPVVRAERHYSYGKTADVTVSGVMDFSSPGTGFTNKNFADVKVTVMLAESSVLEDSLLSNVTLEATGALLGNTWIASSEEQFNSIVSHHTQLSSHNLLALDDTLADVEKWAVAANVVSILGGLLYPVEELLDATSNIFGGDYFSVLPTKQSMILPDYENSTPCSTPGAGTCSVP